MIASKSILMKTNWQILILLLCSVFFIIGCDCDDPTDPECGNYDPCFFAEEKPTLDFRIYQSYAALHTPEFTTDTFFPGDYVSFQANMENAIRYEWRIGVDTFVTEDGYFNIQFKEQDSILLVNAPVAMTLIVEYEPDLECFPNRMGRDSITKLIHFRHPRDAAYFGKWRVVVNGDTDNPYDIEIKKADPSTYRISKVDIFNLYNEGSNCRMRISGGYRLYSFFEMEHTYLQDPCGQRIHPYGMLDIDCYIQNEEEIYMTWKDDELAVFPGTSIWRSLEGYKIE